MLTCPRCRVTLRSVASPDGPRAFACPSCGGRAATLEALRPRARKGQIAMILEGSRDAGGPDGPPCPACAAAMKGVRLAADREDLELDACPQCRLVWFDPAEMARFLPPSAPDLPRRAPDLPLEARVALATWEARRVRERAEAEDRASEGPFAEGPAEPWQWIPAVLGLPLEVGERTRTGLPLATWGLAAALLVLGLLGLDSSGQSARALGFLPADPWRGMGLTWISSLVIHGGAWHLLSNLYFLVVFGDDVEEALGPWRVLLLFLVAGLAGNALHGLLDPRPQVPLIGASGAISGLLAFYGLRFPRARVALAFRLFWRFAFLRLPVWVALGLWLVLQGLGAASQRMGCSTVSAFAHLGGFSCGVVAWAVVRWSARHHGA
ncbi:rhomboid family intramembrane serine protease [Myxococcota bacterium]|nr:rhomboid family intramembrane serine protease [Myxococcota bacterium]